MKFVPAGSFNEALTWYVTSVGNGFDVLLPGHEHFELGRMLIYLRTCMADGLEGLNLVTLNFGCLGAIIFRLAEDRRAVFPRNWHRCPGPVSP